MVRQVLTAVAFSLSLFLPSAGAEHVVEKHISAAGGAERLSAVESMQRSGRADVDSPAGRFSGVFQESYDLAHDSGLTTLTTSAFRQRTGWVGDEGWKEDSLQGLADMNTGELGLTKITAAPSVVASIYRQYGLAAFQAVEDAEFGGAPCDLVRVTGSPLEIYLDKDTHLLRGLAIPNLLEMTFDDYRAVEGIQLPHHTATSIPVAGLTVSYEYDATTLFNVELDQRQFERPATEEAAQAATITYSDAQAAAGKTAYAKHCASCHSANLRGGHLAPSLVGARFDQHWRGKSAEVLSFHIRRMPPDSEEGPLDDETQANLLAFVLQSNGLAAGAPLPPKRDALKKLSIPRLEGVPFNPDAPVSLSRRQRENLDDLTPVTAEMLAKPPAEGWLSWGRAADGWSYSPLDVVGSDNVSHLALAWRAPLRPGPSMSLPLVHGGVMFVQSYPDTTLALDAETGDVLWRYQHQTATGSSQKMGIALFGDRVFVPTSDLHVVALEAKTGKVVWDHAIDIVVPEGGRRGHQLRSAPLIAGDRVIQGVTASFASRGGFLVALDLKTGEEAWRFDTIAKPGEPGGNSWNGVPYDKRSGGSVWHQGTYDPELNLVYYGVAPTYDTGPLLQPIDEEGVTNDALYTNCTIALKPESGELVWHYQHMPNDQWDLDWAFERQIVEVVVDGEKRKAVANVGKVAILEAVDAATGEYLFSVDTGSQNVITAIDSETGAKTFDLEKMPDPKRSTVVCPSAAGGRSWPPTAYSPRTEMVYVPITEWCMTLGPTGARLLTSGVGISEASHPAAADGKLARLQAIDVANRKLAWKHEQVAPISTGILATAGGILFAGDLEPSLKAFDAANGRLLWHEELDDVPSSSIITYSVGGTQYVAVLVGIDNLHVSALNQEYARFLSEKDVAPAAPKGGASIWVFSL